MREATLWTLHLLAGIVILVLLGIHMGIMHLDSILLTFGTGYENALSWASVVTRSKRLFFEIAYIMLLGTALYHGLYGLRNILFELNLREKTEKAVNWIFLVVGLTLFVLGTYATIVAYRA